MFGEFYTVGKHYITIYRKTIWVHTNYIIFFKTSRVRRKSVGIPDTAADVEVDVYNAGRSHDPRNDGVERDRRFCHIRFLLSFVYNSIEVRKIQLVSGYFNQKYIGGTKYYEKEKFQSEEI